MSIRLIPFLYGLVAIGGGLLLTAGFRPTDPYVVQAQLGAGGIAILFGLYLVLVVAKKEEHHWSTFSSPRLRTLIGRDARGRAFRTITTVAAISVVIGALFATMLLNSGAAYSIDTIRDKLGGEIIVVPQAAVISQQPFYTFFYNTSSNYVNTDLAQTLASIPGVKEVSPELLISQFSPSGGCGGLSIEYIVAIDPANNLMLRSWLPGNVTQPLAANTAILGAEVPPFYTLPGQGKFYGVQLQQQARLPRTGTFMDHMLFISFDTAENMLQWQTIQMLTMHAAANSPEMAHMLGSLPPLTFQKGQVTDFSVKLQDGANAEQVASQIESTISNVRALTLNSLVKSASLRLSGLLSIFSYAGGLVWVGSVLLVSTVTTLAVNERRTEIGLIRAVGGTRGFIRRMVTAQTLLLASVAGLIGIIGGYAYFYTSYVSIELATGIPFVFPPLGELAGLMSIALLLAVLTGGVASLWPTRIANR
ncbi:MAG: FtsX-like permease family protein, partial [Thaumarchaeota archaeon]|nr:FtsX-like permease family protein [Nitrososphaerota archaeon]